MVDRRSEKAGQVTELVHQKEGLMLFHRKPWGSTSKIQWEQNDHKEMQMIKN